MLMLARDGISGMLAPMGSREVSSGLDACPRVGERGGFSRCLPPWPRGGPFAFILAVLVLLVACGGGGEESGRQAPRSVRLEACAERGGYCGLLEPGGKLTAAAWLDADRMYLADYEGRIRLLNVETGAVRTVQTGLSIPQGLTVLNGRLYVSDMGNVCEVMFEEEERLENANIAVFSKCALQRNRGYDVSVFLDFLGKASARVFSYRIGENGALDDMRVIIDRIITYARSHSAHGLTHDSEHVYVSIGHAQFDVDPDGGFWVERAEQLRDMALRSDLLGTIVRIDPSDQFEVYATGFRNVYGISVAPDGTIYGADNDEEHGLSKEGQREELNAIVEGGFHGFPFYGTHEAPDSANVTEPVAILRGYGSTAIHAGDTGVYVAYIAAGETPVPVIERFDYETFMPVRIYTGNQKQTGEPSYVVGILERDNFLYIPTFAGNVHVIDPESSPVLGGAVLAAEEFDRILASAPIISESYDVYLDEFRLIYIKDDCTMDERDLPFLLHIHPVNPDDLSEETRDYGFENRDFMLDQAGYFRDGRCVAVRFLPDYEIDFLITGQYIVGESDGQTTFERVWTGGFSLRE